MLKGMVTLQQSKHHRNKLVSLLLRARGDWVSRADVIAAAGDQYGARVYECRHDLKLQIENWQEGGRSWFRLVSGPTSTPQPKPEPPKQSDLFDNIAPDRSYRE
jgi:hypothetical protein